MLNDWNAPYIQSLMRLMETQSKRTLAMRAVRYSEEFLLSLWVKQYPNDRRPQEALQAARDWLAGTIKLPQATARILEYHSAAREAEGMAVDQAAARAIGQCASSIHSARHSIGLAFCGTLALAYEQLGTDASWEELERCAAAECRKMEAALRAVAVENEPDPAAINWNC